MSSDFAFPSGNENSFLAVKKNVVFLYPRGKGLFSGGGVSVRRASGDDRGAFEQGVGIIFGLEFSEKKDFIFHRNSGMNQVLAKIAKEKGVAVGFSFSGFRNAGNKPAVLGRMRQNFALCRKYKVEVVVASFASSPGELASDEELASFRRLLEKTSFIRK